MKTLDTIQKFAKVGKILCKIIFIFSLIGGIGSAIGIFSLAIIPEGLQIGDTTIRGLIEESAEVSLGTCYASMATSMILCAGEAVLCKIAEKYFINELAAGTPFTLAGSKEMLRLGICTIAIPLGSQLVAAIVYGIFKLAMKDVAALDSSVFGSGSVGLGIMFLVTSLLCRHGAEIAEKEQDQTPKIDLFETDSTDQFK